LHETWRKEDGGEKAEKEVNPKEGYDKYPSLMPKLLTLFQNSKECQEFFFHFSQSPLSITLPPTSATAFLLFSLSRYYKVPLIFISGRDLESLHADLLSLNQELADLGIEIIYFQPQPRIIARFNNRPANFILLLKEEDLNRKIPTDLEKARVFLRSGEKFSYERLLDYLADDYYPTDFVMEEGEFARRGSIIDFFPPDTEYPLRVEFFGDKIVSLRLFDPLNQRSVKELVEYEIFLPHYLKKEGETIRSLLKGEMIFLWRKEGKVFLHHQRQMALAKATDSKEFLEYHLSVLSPDIYLGNFKVLKSEIARGDFQYYIVVPQYLQERLEKILGEVAFYQSGSLSGGFLLPESKICLLTEKEIYGEPKIRPPKRKFKGLPVDELLALKKGDYVVHFDYGVGIFEGVKRLTFDNTEKDFLTIRYAGDDRLYLPIENLGLIERYIGSEERAPKIDRIGRSDWAKAKEETEIAANKFASELLDLYAQRATAEGFSFSSDSEWQMELESSFPYEETPDQLKALEEIKRDMERKRPMERLVCGDVGFGKTELALRAAFKAVQDFKQVAFLVPTTLLALQHYHNFKERLKNFPVRVEMLSRLLKKEEQKKISQDLKEGKVDIVIGTHLLLSDKISFKDLGLLIIDEEQKFGVRQKEEIKKWKRGVDVLSLTATPIPRTLYLSLTGIKDISIINTPPLGRKEIITEVSTWDEKKIREMIMREVCAGGQVFFIHNRIETIYRKEEELSRICPEIKIAVAHGRMREEKLARVYFDFLNRRYDLLLTTAIMESGIDMPNVNIIIIDEAHRFGLADLHQLRGRVGRGERQAYCLFIRPDKREITEEAKQRISALITYSQLGSGFKLAIKDMEIRGVGNILGPEQHGHISRVGFALYNQLLKDAVKRLRGEKILPEPELSLNIPAYIPEDFIPDSYVRVAIYKRILNAETEEEIRRLKEEIRDRFGRYPEIMENLFLIAQIRIYAKKKGIEQVVFQKGEIKLIKEGKEERCSGDLTLLLARLKEG